MSNSKPDVLLLGATGFTGRLIAQYLGNHRESASFNLSLAARSKSRLENLASELELSSAVKLVVLDVTRPEQIEAAVKDVTVVINTVGPYWTWGTPVVHACVQHGVHYVDLTGEPHWTHRIITLFDYTATKTGAIIVPSCGFDSVPADITTYISNKTLSETPGAPFDADTSVTAYSIKGGFSGGTVSTLISAIEDLTPSERELSAAEYSNSPIVGTPSPPNRLIYRLFLPDSRKTITGASFFMRPANRPVVQRTWGLLEREAAGDRMRLRYGPAFKYDEFLITGNAVRAVLLTLGMAVGFGCMLISPLRWILKKLLPKAGEGPSEKVRNSGFMKVVNLTTAVASPAHPTPVQVKTVMTGTGDPGYSLTAVIISEAGLSLALTPRTALPALARRGGVLTPATALGDVFIERMTASGRIKFESIVVNGPEARKHV
ncbi:Saccharopine dehydrogenase-domain-containing protein [Mycena rebaudengoi]|nr:Saccharopine dehydrogenase-domain-containing protein [Mycena rebaudengoi]